MTAASPAVTLSRRRRDRSSYAGRSLLGSSRAPSYISRPNGQVAQLVEQRTENPRVGGSIPSLATKVGQQTKVTRSRARRHPRDLSRDGFWVLSVALCPWGLVRA